MESIVNPAVTRTAPEAPSPQGASAGAQLGAASAHARRPYAAPALEAMGLRAVLAEDYVYPSGPDTDYDSSNLWTTG